MKKIYERTNKDTYYLDIATAVSKRSTCLKRHYGAVIVKDDEIIATGYNGAPRGEKNCSDCGICNRINSVHNDGNYSSCHAVHAEQNAMLSASRKDMLGGTLYLSGENLNDGSGIIPEDGTVEFHRIIDAVPCPICARMISNAGITRIVNYQGEVTLSF